MGWIDDRIYCHPKVLMVTKPARWTYVAGIAYSSGWGTRGVLERSALEAIGCEAKHRNELVKAGLWISVEGVVWINDWDEHNQKRDERRIADRERKRRLRHPELSAGQNADSPVERPVERPQDGSALKEVKEVKSEGGTSSVKGNPRAFTELDHQADDNLEHAPANGTKGPGEIESISSTIQRSLEEARNVRPT